MKNSMRSHSSNQGRPGKPQGGNNVTQNSDRPDKRDTGKGKSQKAKDGNVPAPSTAPGSNERNTRDDRSGSASAGKPRSGGHGSGSSQPVNKPKSFVSGSEARGKSRSRSRERGLAGQLPGKTTDTDRNIRRDGNPRSAVRSQQIENEAAIKFFVAVWRAMFLDFCPQAVDYFDEAIGTRGYDGTITWFSQLAMQVINSTPGSILETEFISVLQLHCNMRQLLQLLRFGKRFGRSDWSADEERDILSAFLSRNNRCKRLDRNPLPTWLLTIMREVSDSIFNSAYRYYDDQSGPGKRGTWKDFLSDRSFATDWKAFPSGTTAEGMRNEFEKYLSLCAGYGLIDPYLSEGIAFHEAGVYYDSTSAMKFVPKDYRGPRIIMEEDLEVTLRQTPIANGLLRIINLRTNSPFCPEGCITLDDQTRNQELAVQGASDKYYATIDLSNASDCISTRLVYAALPEEVAHDVVKNASKAVVLTDGRTVPLYIPCTMGSRDTVPTQSMCYWVVVMTAVELGVRYDLWSYDIARECAVYNDDIIVPSVMYDMVVALLAKVGLVVNSDKSYTDDHPFRESCGVDAYETSIVTSIYWPRKTIELTSEFLPSLCSLQNKLYAIQADRAAQLVSDTVLGIQPNTPIRMPHSETICLWGNKSNYKVVPYADAVRNCGTVPEGIGLMETYELRQTYDNRLVSCANLLDGRFVTPTHINMLAEKWEYDRWLLFGSEYYDELTRFLGITMPSKPRKHLVPLGYTAKKAYSSIADPRAIQYGDRERNLRLARQSLFNARQAKKMKNSKSKMLND